MKNKTIHISIPQATMLHYLKPFAASRGRSMSAIILYALDKLFQEESLDYEKEEAMRAGIERLFLIPRGYSPRSFWITLFMLASKYPKAKARSFWGSATYTGPDDWTHQDVVDAVVKYGEETTTLEEEEEEQEQEGKGI